MYVSIHAVDADIDEGPFSPKGKRTRVESTGLEFYTFGTDLSIRAKVSETFGTGRRGGSTKTVNRRLIIELNKHDLARILEEAIKSHLVTIPGSRAVGEAMELLKSAAAEMGLKG
jgi:hypothetical protein